ncbi:hypothetical protein M4J07_008866 [Streptomyces longispororuber]|nr:hypothetical protein [Streptomyces longispororuber]MCQ4209969.1 hypothetical protein [Streptomyces longispororuber]
MHEHGSSSGCRSTICTRTALGGRPVVVLPGQGGTVRRSGAAAAVGLLGVLGDLASALGRVAQGGGVSIGAGRPLLPAVVAQSRRGGVVDDFVGAVSATAEAEGAVGDADDDLGGGPRAPPVAQLHGFVVHLGVRVAEFGEGGEEQVGVDECGADMATSELTTVSGDCPRSTDEKFQKDTWVSRLGAGVDAICVRPVRKA